MNTIEWTVKALKQLRKIQDKDQAKGIYLEAQALSHFPDCAGVKKLSNHRYPYRLRVGGWRVFFQFDGTIKIIRIEEVKKRDEHTY